MSATLFAAARKRQVSRKVFRTNPRVVALEAHRIDAGSGVTAFTFGIPLLPEQLHEDDINNVSLWVNGVEVAAFRAARAGRYAGGYVIALKVQFDFYMHFGLPYKAELRLDVPPNEEPIAERTLTYSATDLDTWHTDAVTNQAGILVSVDREHMCQWGGWWNELAPYDTVQHIDGFTDWADGFLDRENAYFNNAQTAGGSMDPTIIINGAGQYDRISAYGMFQAMYAAPFSQINDFMRKALRWYCRVRDAVFIANAFPDASSEPGIMENSWYQPQASAMLMQGAMMAHFLFCDEDVAEQLIKTHVVPFSSDHFGINWDGVLVSSEVRAPSRPLRAFWLWDKMGFGNDTSLLDTFFGDTPTKTYNEWCAAAIAHIINDGNYPVPVGAAPPLWYYDWTAEPPYEDYEYESIIFQNVQLLQDLQLHIDSGRVTASGVETEVRARIFAQLEYLWSLFAVYSGTTRKSFPYAIINGDIEHPLYPIGEAVTLNGLAAKAYAWVAARYTGETRATYVARTLEIMSTWDASGDGNVPPLPALAPSNNSVNGKAFSENYVYSPFVWKLLLEAGE